MKVICKLVGRWEIKRPIADPLGISSLSEYKGSRQENQLGRVVGQREQVVLTCPWRTFESHHLFLCGLRPFQGQDQAYQMRILRSALLKDGDKALVSFHLSDSLLSNTHLPPLSPSRALTCLGASDSGSVWPELFTVKLIFSCWMTHCQPWTLMWPSISLTKSSGQKVCWQAR